MRRALLIFFLTITAIAQRQFWDDDHPCLSDWEGCPDDAHIFKDDEIGDPIEDIIPFPSDDLFDAPSPDCEMEIETV